jgi:hypothetical protein
MRLWQPRQTHVNRIDVDVPIANSSPAPEFSENIGFDVFGIKLNYREFTAGALRRSCEPKIPCAAFMVRPAATSTTSTSVGRQSLLTKRRFPEMAKFLPSTVYGALNGGAIGGLHSPQGSAGRIDP